MSTLRREAMNERIEYLALLANHHANELHPNNIDMENWAKVYHEKFAELIVRECAEVLLKWKGEPFPFDEDLAANLIKEHFGVEE